MNDQVSIFHYIASDNSGQSVRGTLSATSKTEVAKKLQEKGLLLVSCRPETPVLPNPTLKSAVPTPNLQTSPPYSPAGGKISLKALAALTRQMSISVKAGMSFVETLQRMSQRSKNPHMAAVLRAVLNDILAGKRFSEALAGHPDLFTPLYISMVAAGETGGFMPEALNRVADLLEKEISLNAKIRSAMIYPLCIALVAAIVLTGVMLFIIPVFIRIFQEMNIPLPLPTKILVACSLFFRRGGFLFPVIFIGLFFGAKKLRLQNESFRRFYDETLLRVPVFGKLVTLEVITRFVRTLSSLVSNGVMALEAISVARRVVQNRALEGVIDELFTSVQSGNGLSPVLYRSAYFPELVADMVATGESTGTLPDVLDKIADYYDEEVSSAVRDILTMVEPLMIMVMAMIVGLIIVGIMLPMIGMPGAIG